MSTTEAADSSLFMQLLVFTDCSEIKPLLLPLKHLPLDCVVYKDLNDPQGFALLAVADDPELFVTDLRDVLCSRLFRVLMQRHDLTMTGRTWGDANSNIDQLEAVVKDEEWAWVLWYPMRGTPAFAALNEAEQVAVLDGITSSTGLNAGDFGHVRLKSHALDRDGNEFIHGVHARSPHDLSRFIEAFTRAEQHAEHIASAGPFFIGRDVRGADVTGGRAARW
jgi:chlorite dismutase